MGGPAGKMREWMRLFLPTRPVPDSLTAGGQFLLMHRRLIAIFAILCLALGGGGCASKSRGDYEEVLMPLQTGSVIQRRVQVKTDRQTKPKKEKEKEKEKEKKKPAPPKPEPEPEGTPAPQEESTPPPERFR